MGNGALCRNRPGGVRVLRPDGGIEEFEDAIQVTEVMWLYPDYLVVHCTTGNQSMGQRNKITVMEFDDVLVPGQSYLLYPIPSQFKRSFCAPRAYPQQDGMSGPRSANSEFGQGQSHEAKESKANRKRRRSLRVKTVMYFLRNILTGESSFPTQEASDRSLLEPRQEEETFALDSEDVEPLKEQPRKKPMLFIDPYAWRPALDCIPESPLGFHDIPQSPYAYQLSVPSSPKLQSPRALVIPAGLGIGLERCLTPPLSPSGIGYGLQRSMTPPRSPKGLGYGVLDRSLTPPRSPKGLGYELLDRVVTPPRSPQGLQQGLERIMISPSSATSAPNCLSQDFEGFPMLPPSEARPSFEGFPLLPDQNRSSQDVRAVKEALLNECVPEKLLVGTVGE